MIAVATAALLIAELARLARSMGPLEMALFLGYMFVLSLPGIIMVLGLVVRAAARQAEEEQGP